MFVYEKIFSYVLDKYSTTNSNHYNDNNIVYILSCHLLSHSKMNLDDYNIIKYIHYKYYILKNFIFNPSTSHEDKEIILKIFCEVQCKYNALVRFKQTLSVKIKKYLSNPVDLDFSELGQVKEHLKIDIIHQGIKYNFSVSDLIRIINTSLSYDDEFFPEPTVIKNPWNNKPFGKNNLYSIYFRILHSSVKMPILFSRFFHSNFNLKDFVYNNQYIINKYIIENSNNMTNTMKYRYITEMIIEYNLVNSTYRINIGKSFPKSIIHEVFNSYLKLYLFAYYSYEDDIRRVYRKKLFKKLKHFNTLNPYFGSVVKFNDIYKMYYLSIMIEKSDFHIFGVPQYFPKPSMFCLKEKVFYIDSITSYAEINEFSYFPLFKNRNEDNQTNHILKCNDILNAFKFVRNYIFSEIQLDFIKNNYNNHIDTNITSETGSDINDMSDQLRELLSNLHQLQVDIDVFNDTISDDDSINEEGTRHGVSLITTSNNTSLFIQDNTIEGEYEEYEEMYNFHTLFEESETLDGFTDNNDDTHDDGSANNII